MATSVVHVIKPWSVFPRQVAKTFTHMCVCMCMYVCVCVCVSVQHNHEQKHGNHTCGKHAGYNFPKNAGKFAALHFKRQTQTDFTVTDIRRGHVLQSILETPGQEPWVLENEFSARYRYSRHINLTQT